MGRAVVGDCTMEAVSITSVVNKGSDMTKDWVLLTWKMLLSDILNEVSVFGSQVSRFFGVCLPMAFYGSLSSHGFLQFSFVA